MEFPPLPRRVYHIADKLGEGACGAVRSVYDDEGACYALKTFDAAEDGTLASETIREVSALRAMIGAHPNVLSIADAVVSPAGEVTMAMPVLAGGNLTEAVEKGLLVRGARLRVAHGLLSALAWLHAQRFVHRDVKGDNVMLDASGGAVLIDFSLAKSVGGGGGGGGVGSHTGNVGTAKYIAPEVYRGERYGTVADVYSAGVVLLEVFCGALVDADRDKAAFPRVAAAAAALEDARPATAVVRAALAADPENRPSAYALLGRGPLKARFGDPPRYARALAFAPEPGAPPPDAPGKKARGKKRRKKAPPPKKAGPKAGRAAAAGRAWDALECANPLSLAAAAAYAEKCGAADPSHCALLAAKVYEADFCVDLEDEEGEPDSDGDVDRVISDYLPGFDLGAYAASELAILAAMDFCLLLPEAAAGGGDP